MSKQPRDDGNIVIPLLGYKPNGGQIVAITTNSSTSAIFGNATRVISLYTTVDSFFEIGDGDVEANVVTSYFIPAGVYLDVSLGSNNNANENYKYLAVISSGTGSLYISERI